MLEELLAQHTRRTGRPPRDVVADRRYVQERSVRRRGADTRRTVDMQLRCQVRVRGVRRTSLREVRVSSARRCSPDKQQEKGGDDQRLRERRENDPDHCAPSPLRTLFGHRSNRSYARNYVPQIAEEDAAPPPPGRSSLGPAGRSCVCRPLPHRRCGRPGAVLAEILNYWRYPIANAAVEGQAQPRQGAQAKSIRLPERPTLQA